MGSLIWKSVKYLYIDGSSKSCYFSQFQYWTTWHSSILFLWLCILYSGRVLWLSLCFWAGLFTGRGKGLMSSWLVDTVFSSTFIPFFKYMTRKKVLFFSNYWYWNGHSWHYCVYRSQQHFSSQWPWPIRHPDWCLHTFSYCDSVVFTWTISTSNV